MPDTSQYTAWAAAARDWLLCPTRFAKAPARWVLGHDSCAHFVGDQNEGELGPLHIIRQGVDSGGDLLIREFGCHQIGDPEGHAVN